MLLVLVASLTLLNHIKFRCSLAPFSTSSGFHLNSVQLSRSWTNSPWVDSIPDSLQNKETQYKVVSNEELTFLCDLSWRSTPKDGFHNDNKPGNDHLLIETLPTINNTMWRTLYLLVVPPRIGTLLLVRFKNVKNVYAEVGTFLQKDDKKPC